MLLASFANTQNQEWKEVACVFHTKPIMRLAFKDSGPMALYTANDSVSKIDEKLTLSTVISSNQSTVRALDVSFDGSVSIARGNLVEIWSKGVLTQTLEHWDAVTCCVWDGQYLVSGTDFTVFVWNPLSGSLVTRFQVDSLVLNLTLSIQRKSASCAPFVLCHSSQTYHVWNLANREPLLEAGLVRSAGSLSCAAITSSFAMFGCIDGMCIIVQLGTNASKMRRLAGHTNYVRSVVFSIDETRAVTGSWDCSLRVWNVETGEAVRVINAAHSSYVTAGRFFGANETYLVSTSSDKTLKIFDLHEKDRERIVTILLKPKPGSSRRGLPLDVVRRVKLMLF